MEKEDFNGKVVESMIEIAESIKNASIDMRQNSKISYLLTELQRAKEENCKVFVFGAGRSGLVGKANAMRLMHLGYKSYFIGDTTTPSIQSKDLVIVISGSGETNTVIAQVRIIITKIGAKVFAITSNPESTLGRIVDENCAIYVPGRKEQNSVENYEERRLRGTLPLVPLGSQFEINALVFCDSVIRELMEILGVTEKDMQEIHAIE